MKTQDIINILRCSIKFDGDSCDTCPTRFVCETTLYESFNLATESANRLEQLLINLRTTQEQLQIAKGERDAWRKRYMKLQNSLKNVVHENELLDNLMN